MTEQSNEAPELAPCRCGRKAMVEEFHDDDDPQPLFVATCEVCPVQTYEQFTAAEAARIWNEFVGVPSGGAGAELASMFDELFNCYTASKCAAQDSLEALRLNGIAEAYQDAAQRCRDWPARRRVDGTYYTPSATTTPTPTSEPTPERTWIEWRTQHAFAVKPEPYVETVEYARVRSKDELLDALSYNPTEEEAEAVLQACGTSGREVVNEFIERLLRENLELNCEHAVQAESITEFQREQKTMREALDRCYSAIRSLPESALGIDPQYGHWLRDELMARIEAAITPKGEQPK